MNQDLKSLSKRSESYEHTESSMSLYEGHSEPVSEEYTEHLFPFKRSDYTTDFTNEFTGGLRGTLVGG